MTQFSGWAMPLQYVGIVEEHLAVRRSVGLFDVSHMGKIFLEGEGAHALLDRLSAGRIPSDPGRGRYTHILREDGTTLDDVIVTCLSKDRYFVVCNAAARASVVAWFNERGPASVVVVDRTKDFLCLALQGPRASDVLERWTTRGVRSLRRFEGAVLDSPAWREGTSALPPPEIEGWGGPPKDHPRPGEPAVSGGNVRLLVTRTGYTGEEGFELFPPVASGVGTWEALLALGHAEGIRPVGLGARDTLRLEKGYLLAGRDFDGRQTPLELGCGWLVGWDRAFVGKDALKAQRSLGDYPRLVGLRMEGRGIPRQGQRVAAWDGTLVGLISSGTLSPSLGVGIALASVPQAHAAPGSRLRVEIRQRLHPARVERLPFL